MKKIDIVIPCYNESKCVELIYDALKELFSNELKAYSFSVLYIDDGSKDDTLERIVKLSNAENSNVRYISFARNFGKESAIYAGLENADGDYVALMDADLQHPPHLLIDMLHAIEEEGYDCATARRVKREKESRIRNLLSNSFYHVINLATGMKLAPGMTDYRLMKKQVADAIVSMREHERFIKGIYSWIGFNSKWIEYENVERVDGDSKWNYKGLWNYAKTGIIAFAVAPLRAVIYLGFLVILISFVYGVRLYAMSISGARPWQDTTTILLLLLFLGGMIILLLGIIGEYLARIYMEVKNRPIYIAKEKKLDVDKD
ncbi:Glycosyltransferase involved in cell wall bisynthesis [Butyrivibrio fibrisolvens DSM 3071]|uniref:Glycosyltransferase involved in cell wall bisynthesis n=1 Tax=Butyrivibrio fibrisolvens DSM 3071 TaxID=1121131 RepID=A0A1M6A922_BUTFI|nr:glycosyltransferase family 2 protein [Butyrivibrio fibrisolvens]SHI32951.1 Glycosyltransferase involved in cell wall bisynthesis [Butyrivibrio fibrisolvens DSM 3071]